MDTKKIFRALIIAKWVIDVLGTFITLSGIIKHPPELQSYLDNQLQSSTIFFIAIVFITVWIGLSYKLYNFHKGSRILYILCLIASYMLTLQYGYSINSGIENIFSYIDSTIDGMIIALMYFSPVNSLFDKKTV